MSTARRVGAALCLLLVLLLGLGAACSGGEPPEPDLDTPQGVLTQTRISMQDVVSYQREGHVVTTSAAGETRVDLQLDWSAPEDVHLVTAQQVDGRESQRRELVFVGGALFAKDSETGGVWERQPNQPAWSFPPSQAVPRLCFPEFAEHADADPDEVVIQGYAALREWRGQDGESACEPARHVFYTVWIRQPEYLLTRLTLTVDGSLDESGTASSDEREKAAYTFSRYYEPVEIEAPIAE